MQQPEQQQQVWIDFIGVHGKTRDQIADRFGGLDEIPDLIANGYARRRWTDVKRAWPRSRTDGVLMYVLTDKGALTQSPRQARSLHHLRDRGLAFVPGLARRDSKA